VSALYYILDTRTMVGNCALWWKPDGGGYTCNLDEAGFYTEDQIRGLRTTDVPVPIHVAEAHTVKHVRADEPAMEEFVRRGRP
jgi:hypothetical protein